MEGGRLIGPATSKARSRERTRSPRKGEPTMTTLATRPSASQNRDSGTRADLKSENGAASILAYGPARSTITGTPLSPEELELMDAYWRASLYLCLGMLYLQDNPLLREPLKIEHVKPRMLGHWGSDAGQAFTY